MCLVKLVYILVCSIEVVQLFEYSLSFCWPTRTIRVHDAPISPHAVWGRCKHCFHMHCILKWIQSQSSRQLCPMCRQEWKISD